MLYYRQDLSEHRSTVHRGLELHKRTPRPPYGVFPEACDICGKQLKSKLNVLRHKQSFHNESYAFRCDVCDQRFKTQISLRRHKTAHEKPRYKCEVGEQINAPISTIVVCFSRPLKSLRSLFGKQRGPRSDCSYRSSLFWVHTVCFCT